MFEKLQNLIKLHEEAMKELRAQGEACLKEAFSDFFKAHPNVSAIRWAQYTPYFNDGDPCNFSVREASARFESDEFLDSWEMEQKGFAAENETLGKLEGFLQSDAFEPVMQAIFGDHVEVTVTPTEITIDTYSHD